MAVMNDAPPIPWDEIKARYLSGEKPSVLAEKYAFSGISLANLRKRIVTGKWAAQPGRIPIEAKAEVDRSVKKVINQEIRKHAGTIKQHTKAAVEKCEAAALAMAQEFVNKATEKVRTAETKELSSVATLGRAGVDIWRTTLGMNATGSAGGTSAISVSFVLKGQGPAFSPETLRMSHETSPEKLVGNEPEEPPIDI